MFARKALHPHAFRVKKIDIVPVRAKYSIYRRPL